MPSFIDSHSHVVSLASTLKLVDLSKATSIAQIIQCFKNYIEENNPTSEEMLIGLAMIIIFSKNNAILLQVI